MTPAKLHPGHAQPSTRPGANDGKFTWKEALWNIAAGAWGSLTGIVDVFKKHPLLSTAVTGGFVALLIFLPVVTPFVIIGSVIWSSFNIARGTYAAAQKQRSGDPDGAERALGGVGEGLMGLGFAALGEVIGQALQGTTAASAAQQAVTGSGNASQGQGGVGDLLRNVNPAALIETHELPAILGAFADARRRGSNILKIT